MNLVDVDPVGHSTIQDDMSEVPQRPVKWSTSLTGTENTGSATMFVEFSKRTPDIGISTFQEYRNLIRRFVENIGSDYPEETFADPALPINQSVAENYVLIFGEILSRSKNDFQKSPDLSTQINDATHHEGIFNILDLTEHQKIAKRLRYLHKITQNDDPEDPAMELISLRELALFFASDDVSLPDPEIGISPDGLLQAEWHFDKASALMKFLLDGNIRFAARMDDQDGLQTIQGTRVKDIALQAIWPFINQS